MNLECSIVVPLYNKQAEIRRCLESVLAQTRQDFEVIVVNDGSRDEGAAIVAQFCKSDNRIQLYDQSNQGVAAARNRGVSLARAECVAFLDADDEWLPEHLASLCSLRAKSPEASLWFTAYWVDRGGGWRRRIRIPRRFLARSGAMISDYFTLHEGKFVPSGSMMLKAAIEAVGGYRQMFGEDVDIWLRMAARHPVGYSAVPTAVWHVDAGNRRCAQQGQNVNLHNPCSLNASLAQIVADAALPLAVKVRATDYVARRERKAIVDTLLAGQRAHAVYLYDSWKSQFHLRSFMVEYLLSLPIAAFQCLKRARRWMRSANSLTAYILELPVNVLLFHSR